MTTQPKTPAKPENKPENKPSDTSMPNQGKDKHEPGVKKPNETMVAQDKDKKPAKLPATPDAANAGKGANGANGAHKPSSTNAAGGQIPRTP